MTSTAPFPRADADEGVDLVIAYTGLNDWRAVARALLDLPAEQVAAIETMAAKLAATAAGVRLGRVTATEARDTQRITITWSAWHDHEWVTLTQGHAPVSFLGGVPSIAEDLNRYLETWLTELGEDGVRIAPGLYKAEMNGHVSEPHPVNPPLRGQHEIALAEMRADLAEVRGHQP